MASPIFALSILFIPFILFILSKNVFSTPNPVIRPCGSDDGRKKWGQDEKDEEDKKDVCHPVSKT